MTNKSDSEIHSFPVAKTTGEQRSTETSAPAVKADPKAKPVKKSGGRRKFVLLIVLLVLLCGGGWYGFQWWTVGRFFVSTDDAYVTADIATISPKVTGYVKELNVTENAIVKKGDPLITIDDGDYKIAIDLAASQLAVQEKTLLRIQAQTEAARASLLQAKAADAAAQAALDNAKLNEDRAQKLRTSQTAPQSALDNAHAAVLQATAGLAGAEAQIAAAKANIAVLEAQYVEAQTSRKTLELQRDKAERDLSFTVLKAPADGVVGNLSTEVGNLVSAGQKLASLVPLSSVYIEANFKETDLVKLGLGAQVNITVDAVGDDVYDGTVLSLSPATGAVFSLLPPENATGNFTKIVQRLPVRIAIGDALLKSGKLHAGLSAKVSVDMRTGSKTN
jgi:membrane fusion protein, multidrug efflux system